MDKPPLPGAPAIEAFFDEPTFTVSYLVADPQAGVAAVIDPVMDYDPASGTFDTAPADRILALADARGWRVELVLETHAHADHLSAGAHIRQRTGARIGIGAHIRNVQEIFRPVFGPDARGNDLATDGSDFDLLLEDGDTLHLGGLEIAVMHVPGHTPADVAYLVGGVAFVGDTLFMPDYGTARADFPGGDARALYRSIARLLALPEDTRLMLCHDYKAPGRDEYRWETTVGEQRRANVHIHAGVDEDAFASMREARDATLAVPRLLLPSIQVNLRAGRLPEPDAQGRRYLRIPVKAAQSVTA